MQAQNIEGPKRDAGTVTVASSQICRATPRLPGVHAELGYLGAFSGRPHQYMSEPPVGTAWQNWEHRLHPVWVADARAWVVPPSVHAEGFELWKAPTAVQDFDDEDAIRGSYYAEAAELARRVTGADHACVFDHALRRREAGRPALGFGRRGEGSRPAAVGRVHNDYSEASGQRRFEIVAVDEDVRARARRFAIVTIWRSIGGTIVDTPLALCDARSVSACDLVATDLRYPHRTGEMYLVRASPRHRWAYFPEMDGDEALVFKQYDSQVSGTARFTPHAAFDLPYIPAGAPLRQSIEARCLVVYD